MEGRWERAGTRSVDRSNNFERVCACVRVDVDVGADDGREIRGSQ